MKLTESDVRYVAGLAHLELTEEEIRCFQPQLAAVLEYMQKLNHLDTTNVEPMAQVIAEGAKAAPLRPDVEQPSLPRDVALANAPAAGTGCFKAPRPIERG